MKVKLVPVQTEVMKDPNGHLFGRPNAGTELRTYSAKVYVDGALYGEASDCDMGRWIVYAPGSKEDGPLDGCYPADSVQALAYAIAECCPGVDHSDVEVA